MARHLVEWDLPPLFTSIAPSWLKINTTYDLVIKGGYFKADTTVSIGWVVVNTVTVVSPEELLVNITTGWVIWFYDMTITSPWRWSTIVSNAIEIIVITYKDLRLGWDTFTDGNGAGNDIRYRAWMSLGRDAAWMFFSGSAPWSSWVKFEVDTRQRWQWRTLEWIMSNPSSFMMIWIWSDQTNEASTSQFGQWEVQAYFNSSVNMWWLFGNNGTPGTTGNQPNAVGIWSNTYKLKFEDDGGVWWQFTLYQLPSANPIDRWDESNIVNSFAIWGTLNPGQTNIMPFIIPQNGGAQRFIAYTVY